jgi:hypothetical protein
MISLGTMIARVCGLADKDVTPWEREFIASISERTHDGKVTTSVTDKQVAIIERIHKQHFGDH